MSELGYSALFYTTFLAIVAATCVRYVTCGARGVIPFNKTMLWPTVAVTVLFTGFRPSNAGDMWSYLHAFHAYATGAAVPEGGDWLFNRFDWVCAHVMGPRAWLLLVAALYNGLLAVAFRSVHEDRFAFPAFLFAAASLGYWNYGTNTIRAGLACSLVVLGLACRGRPWLMAAVLALAVGTHKSMLLPVAAFATTFLCRKPGVYLLGYAASIVVSLTAGRAVQRAVAGWSLLDDDRFSTFLTTSANPRLFRAVGFRWDFLLYSLLPIALGCYYVYRRGFRDPFYLQLFETYLAANAFWILMIRASFSDRFAYLSWFLMPWIIVFPLLEKRLFRRHWAVTSALAGAYFAFTYFMNVVLAWRRA